MAATQFSADGTLNAVKYASRVLSSSITSRHLLCLRGWQADARSKWQLASSFSGGSLFGPSLDPILVEDKNDLLDRQTGSIPGIDVGIRHRASGPFEGGVRVAVPAAGVSDSGSNHPIGGFLSFSTDNWDSIPSDA